MSVERINELQGICKHWKESLTPPADFTPQSEYDRAQQENQELAEAIQHYNERQTPQNAREVAQEAADVIIGMMGVISSVGFDAEGLLDAKLQTMFMKYNPTRNHQLQEQGMSWRQAMTTQKDSYKRNGHGLPTAMTVYQPPRVQKTAR